MYFYWINPDSFLGQLFLVPMASGLMGAAFVYIGTFIAPGQKKTVAIVLSGILLVLSGFLLFPAFSDIYRYLWSIVSAIALNVGSIILTVLIQKDEIDSLVDISSEVLSEE